MHLPVVQCRDRFGRATCGACCMVVGRPPFPGYLRDRGGKPCTELDPATRLCLIYNDRPQACRDVEVGGAVCEKARRHMRIEHHQ